MPWFARIPLRTGFRGEWRYGLLNDVRALDARLDQTVKRFVALGQARDEALPGAARRGCGRGSSAIDATSSDCARRMGSGERAGWSR